MRVTGQTAMLAWLIIAGSAATGQEQNTQLDNLLNAVDRPGAWQQTPVAGGQRGAAMPQSQPVLQPGIARPLINNNFLKAPGQAVPQNNSLPAKGFLETIFDTNNNAAPAKAENARSQAYSYMSRALDKASAADAAAARARSGERSSRQSAAYTAQAYANEARYAAESAYSTAQGDSIASSYASQARAAADRAQSAADRASYSANSMP